MVALVQIGKQSNFCGLAEDLYRHFLLLQSFLDCQKTLNQKLGDVHRKVQSICAGLNKGAETLSESAQLPFTISGDEFLQIQRF
jgi:hypothetical protein